MDQQPKYRGPIRLLRESRRARWAAVAAALLALAYPLSIGPVDYFLFYGTPIGPGTPLNSIKQFFVKLYYPLTWAERNIPPVGAVIGWYDDWWWDLAKRHAAQKKAAVNPPAPLADPEPFSN